MTRRTPITWDDCEDAARHIHAMFGLSFERHVAPVTLAAMLHARLEPGAPRGCRGVGLLDTPLRLHYAGAGEPLAHELLHVALEAIGVPPVHHPDALVELASPVLEIPRGPLRRVLETHGLDAWALPHAYPEVRPSRLYARAALAVDGVAIVHRGRRRTVYAREADAPTWLVPDERALVDAVRRTSAPVRSRGAGAWPMADGAGDHGAIVVLATGDESLALPQWHVNTMA